MSKTRVPEWEVIDTLVDKIGDATREDYLLAAEYDFTKAKKIREQLATREKTSATAILAMIDDDEELNGLRIKIAHKKSELKRANLQFEVAKMQIDLYRTESANARNTS